MKKNFVIVFISLYFSLAQATAASLYFSPSANFQNIIEGIHSAQKSIQLVIFHLNDTEVELALIDAHTRGVKVEVILDGLSLKLPWLSSSKKHLEKAGVSVTASSKAFKITHQKTMVVDDLVAYVTTMNLTKKVKTTRDWGFITRNPAIIAEMDAVFAADLKNAAASTNQTPALKNTNLLWSPVNSKDKLVALIDSAKKTLIGTVENLGNADIQKALIRAATRGVLIKFISPYCTK